MRTMRTGLYASRRHSLMRTRPAAYPAERTARYLSPAMLISPPAGSTRSTPSKYIAESKDKREMRSRTTVRRTRLL
jgi:hypothetical protein